MALARIGGALALWAGLAVPAAALELARGARSEIVHDLEIHDAHLSAPALAVAADGAPLLAWAEQDEGGRHVWVARAGEDAGKPVRVDPASMRPDRAHQPPGLAVGPDGAVYVTWSSEKAKPKGVLLASDLRLSVSHDGGRSFAAPTRVNDDRPISHSFEGLAATADGALVAWIDARDGWEQAGTYAAWMDGGGRTRTDLATVGSDTCVCCRVAALSTRDGGAVLAWRQVFAGNVRDVVAAFAKPGERAFAPAVRVANDGWSLAACPHRGPALAEGDDGRVHVAWYTEGAGSRPRVEVTTCANGACAEHQELAGPPDTVPDHVAVAAAPGGRVLVAWEALTAVRREVVVRASADGGAHFDPPLVLSQAVKAGDPALATAPDGTFVVAWREERFPNLVSVVQTVRLETSPAAGSAKADDASAAASE